jgi:hypothetical protein
MGCDRIEHDIAVRRGAIVCSGQAATHDNHSFGKTRRFGKVNRQTRETRQWSDRDQCDLSRAVAKRCGANAFSP